MPKEFRSPTGCRPAQLFGQWAIEPGWFGQAMDRVKGIDLVQLAKARQEMALAKLSARKPTPDDPDDPDNEDVDEDPDEDDDEGDYEDGDTASFGAYPVYSGVAVMDINGPLTKYQTSFQSLFGGTSTLQVQRQVRLATDDPEVDAIVLRVDSPGGTVAGTSALGDAILQARQKKPVVAQVDGMGASAAYWLASQADAVLSDATSLVGSIGVLIQLEDTSKQYEQRGVKAIVISTGEMKGAGADGTPITDEQRAYFQEIADAQNQNFMNAILRGRPQMTAAQVKSLSDGRVHVGTEALKLGLVDSIGSVEDAFSLARTWADNQLMYGTAHRKGISSL